MPDTPKDTARLANAIAAGWNPDDGDPPFDHGEFVEGIEPTDAEARSHA